MLSEDSDSRMGIYYLSIVGAIAAFGVGVGGLASAFTSITTTTTQLSKRSSSSIDLITAHGKAGLALFVALYAVIPLLMILSFFVDTNRRSRNHTPYGRGLHSRANSNATTEKTALYNNGGRSTPGTTNGLSEEATTGHRPQQRSWSTLGIWSGGRARQSTETIRDVTSSPATLRSFEVVNRGRNFLRPEDAGRPAPKRNLSDLSWLSRRRNMNAVADLDYALNQLNPRQDPPTPGTAVLDIASTRGLVGPIPTPVDAPQIPHPLTSVIHILLHSLILAICGLSLAKLWTNTPRGTFAVFLAWTIIFYLLMFFLSWHGLPRISILSTLLHRIRTDHTQLTPTAVPTTSPVPSRPISSIGLDSIPFPSDQRSPYQHHQHPYRPATTSHDHDYTSMGHESVEHDDGDDIDDETRQQRMEEEMNRRDVSIVTIPKRRLFLTNPERG